MDIRHSINIHNIDLKNKRLFFNNLNHYKRPPSLSESFISDMDKYSRNEYLSDLTPRNEFPHLHLKEEEKALQKEEENKEYKTFHYKDRCEMIINKLILFFLHLFLISMFELVFFFNYVTKYEDSALIDVFNSLTNSVINKCSNLNNQTKIIIDDLFNIFVNTTKINLDALNAYNSRNIINQKLYINAILYFVGIASVNILLFLINIIYYKRRLNYKNILIDNLIMIIILGIYEYIFFTNIIFKYITITPEELTKNTVNNFLLNC